jgi:phosphotransferase system enzyme I (PtsI)
MGRQGKLPGEEEQYQAYKRAVEGMQGLPVTIRTVDVGADKPLDESLRDDAHLNPALGLRAIRWSLADPAMFLTQLRAILRAAAHGKVHLLVPMLAHAGEIRQTLEHLDQAPAQLDNRGVPYGSVSLGAMIEIPAAALSMRLFLQVL